jgi:6-phosphogluconolactonase (cycloisomerase 2 family)
MASRMKPGGPPESGWLDVVAIDPAADAKSALRWGTAIPRTNSLLRDPSGVAFRRESAELFVGNRFGNSGPGTIARFKYSATSGILTDNGSIEHPSLGAVTQISFSPTTGDLFAANFLKNQIVRFSFNARGEAKFENAYPSDGAVGVAVSPSGRSIYVTLRTNTIRHFNVSSGAVLPETAVSMGNLHLMAVAHGHLFVASGTSVVRLNIEANEGETLAEDGAVSAPSAIAVSFSPDATTMFVAEHGGNRITTFRYRSDEKVGDPLGAFEGPPSLEGGDLTALAIVAFAKDSVPVVR